MYKNMLRNRILPIVLALVAIFSLFMPYAWAEDTEDSAQTEQVAAGDSVVNTEAGFEVLEDFHITVDGAPVDTLEIGRNDKVAVTAEGAEAGMEYQWQIVLTDGETWVDIYEQTEAELTVSYPLVRTLLSEEDTTSLRCVLVQDGLRVGYSQALEVAVDLSSLFPVKTDSEDVSCSTEAEEALEGESSPVMYAAAQNGAMAIDAEANLVNVSIEYYYEDRNGNKGDMVVDPYVAHVVQNDPLNVTVPCKVFPGYQIVLVSQIPGVTLNNDEITIDLASVAADMVIEVHYEEIMVPYYARFFVQNVYNDLYVERTNVLSEAEKLAMVGYAGDQPDEDKIHPNIPGFTALFHQPDEIAADGSTVFEVYYDRNYYLINFDMDGGFGTAPVYARYETSFAVSNPTKPGYDFRGWKLIKNGDTTVADSEIAPLPTKIPNTNQTYQAQWKPNKVKYTVAYWIEDDGERTYLGSREDEAEAGKEVSGKDDLQSVNICGMEEHQHTAECYTCSGLVHVHHTAHTKDCYSYITSWTTGVESNADDIAAIRDANLDHLDTDGTYVYFIYTDSNSSYWPKVLINGVYYTVHVNGSQTAPSIAAITEGNELAHGQSGTYHALKYALKADCGLTTCGNDCPIEGHEHSISCCKDKKEEHSHGSCISKYAGYVSLKQMDTDVVVAGDGSTVVNVIYTRKKYTLRFYYARSSKDTSGNITYSVVGGSTYYFGAHGDYPNMSVEQLLANVPTSEWGGVKALPTLKSEVQSKYVTGSITPENSQYTYYYLEFTAPYAAELRDIWPVDIFNSVEISSETTQCPGLKYAYFSAWNGEYKVKYTQDHKSSQKKNETIKGLYMYLDESLVYAKEFDEIQYTDTQGNKTYLVNFLGFWDNGVSNTWSIPKEFRYHIMVPTKDTPLVRGNTYKEYGDVTYEVYKEFLTYDNSELETIDNQTAVAIEGLNHIATMTENADYSSDYANEKLQSVDYYFYYSINEHYLKFWNYNDWLSDGSGVHLAYGTPLLRYGQYFAQEFDMYSKYPDGLEPGAYEFMGWYTTEQFAEGTEVQWDKLTMPDSDLKVYAYWKANTYDVKFYMDYDRLLLGDQREPWYQKTDVPHGEPMKDLDESKILPTGQYVTMDGTPRTDYLFVGWFYIDGTGKKVAFNPSEMAVRKNLDLYAEWTTRNVKEYTVSYGLGYWDAGTKTVIPVTGEDARTLSENTTGYAFEATTRTFVAKSEEQLEVLSAAEKEASIWVPHTNSHSILMKEENSQNEFTFWYVAMEKIPYTVRYVDSATGESVVVDGSPKPDKYVDDNKLAVVTEQFVYVPGYIPDAFHKTLVLSANESENVVVFYYTKDENYEGGNTGAGGTPGQQSSRYLVTHYIQDINKDTYSEYTADDLVGVVGEIASVESLEIPGFTFDHEKSNATWDAGAGKYIVSGTITSGVDGNALRLELYYTRQKFSYKVNYVNRETGQKIENPRILDNGVIVSIPNPKVAATEYAFDSDVTETAPDIIGYDLYSIRTQTLKISTTESLNEITFLYTPIVLTVNYVPVCTSSEATNFGYVLKTSESKVINGTTAIARPGFRFDGWYSDENCENKVESNALFKPSVSVDSGIYEYTYYAKFVPVQEDLVITVSGEQLGDKDSFLFRVTGTDVLGQNVNLTVAIQGAGSVKIKDLYCGTYTVTELTGWSWTYAATNSSTEVVISSADNVTEYQAVFVNSPVDVYWIHGEANLENQFSVASN